MSAPDRSLIGAVVARLTDGTNAEPPAEFPRDPAAVAGPGLYTWFADDEGRATLGKPFGVILPPLIYAGQTGAASRRAGVERVTTLRSRIVTNHLNGNVRSSTFRKTLTSLLVDPLQLRLCGKDRLDQASNREVSSWMRDHLAIVTMRFEDRAALADLEEAILNRLDPPLNLMGMAVTPLRARLRELRGQLKANPT